MVKVRRQRVARVRQGDLLRDVEYIEYVSERSGTIEVSKIVFPLVVVLTQDCDLEQDYRLRWSRNPPSTQDKKLLSVIVAPLYNVEHVYDGVHLSELDIQMQTINKRRTAGNYLVTNQNPRYHYLEFPKDVPVVPSVIDFKHYFTCNVEYLKVLKRDGFVCTLSDMYVADLLQRFASFLSRVGLPEIGVPSQG